MGNRSTGRVGRGTRTGAASDLPGNAGPAAPSPRASKRWPSAPTQTKPSPAWAIADHGLFAAANFIVHVLLARHLRVESYAGFATLFAVVLAVGLLTRALLIEPMLVFGGLRYGRRRRSYIGLVTLQQLALGVLSALVLGGGSVVLIRSGAQTMGHALAGAAVLQYTFSLLMLLRYASYLARRPYIGAAAGAAYLLIVSAAVVMLIHLRWLTLTTALVALVAATLFASALALYLINPELPDLLHGRRLGAVMRRHIRFGRWALAAAAFRFLPTEGYVLLLPLVAALPDVAGLRAVRTLIAPLLLISTALGSLLTPQLANLRGRTGFGGLLWRFTMLALLPFGLAWLFLAWRPDLVLRLMYGPHFSQYADVLWMAGLIPLLAVAHNMAGTGIRALERPDLELWCTLIGASISLPIGLGLTTLEPVGRAILGMVVFHAACTLGLVVALKRCTPSAALPALVQRPI